MNESEGGKIPFHKDMPFPQPRFAIYYCEQYEVAKSNDESLYLECLEVLYKYNLRQKPKGVNHG